MVKIFHKEGRRERKKKRRGMKKNLKGRRNKKNKKILSACHAHTEPHAWIGTDKAGVNNSDSSHNHGPALRG